MKAKECRGCGYLEMDYDTDSPHCEYWGDEIKFVEECDELKETK